MVWHWLLGLWMCGVFAVAIFVVPAAEDFERQYGNGYIAKILFVHVPLAMNCFIAFLVAAVCGWLYLRRRDMLYDIKASASAEVGLIYCVLATLTGAVFSKQAWGAYWNWDPIQVGIFMVLMTYAAYFALRGAFEDESHRASVSSAYAILAFVVSVFSVYGIPRLAGMDTLHPGGLLAEKGGLSPLYRMVFIASTIGFLGLYVWLMRINVRLGELKLKLSDLPKTSKGVIY